MPPEFEIKTVCHLSTVHPAVDARIRDRECATLAHAGYDVHLFVRRPVEESYRGVHLHPLDVPTGRLRRFLYGETAAEKVLQMKPDLVHFHDPELIPAMLRLKKHTDIKVVFDCHEDVGSHLLLKEYIPKAARPAIRALVHFYLKLAAQNFDAVVTADRSTDAFFSRWTQRTVTLFNFPPRDICPYPPNGDFDRRSYDFIYPGSTPRYHLETMFDIAAELKRRGRTTKWLILANLRFENASEWIEANLKKRQLPAYFDFARPVPLSELPHFLRMARIGIIPLPNTPKFHRNIPSKLFDYLLAGLPVLMSDLPPSYPFIAGHDVALAVKPGDIGAYADAAERLLDNPQKLVDMGRKGRSLALRRYTWESQVSTLLALYARLLPQQKRAATVKIAEREKLT